MTISIYMRAVWNAIVWIVTLTCVTAQSITSFSPMSGPIGTTVTIIGSGFGATPADNQVFFGTLRAPVTAASSTQLIISVPTGATSNRISVLANELIASSNLPFNLTFSRGGNIEPDSFMPLAGLSGIVTIFGSTYGDLDADGKLDLIVADYDFGPSSSGLLHVLKNISTNQSLSSSSFAPRITFRITDYPDHVAIGDLDGDGKPDLVVCGDIGFQVLQNTSGPAYNSLTSVFSLPFNTQMEVDKFHPSSMQIEDLDADGKPDLILSSFSTSNGFKHKISVFKNNVSDAITSNSFGLVIETVIDLGTGVTIGDINGDHKPDMVVGTAGEILIFQNPSVQGAISQNLFSNRQSIQNGGELFRVLIADVDGDEKQDLIATARFGSSNSISIYRNIAATTDLDPNSFAPKKDITIAGDLRDFAFGDLNGDSKQDLAIAIVDNFSSVAMVIFQNTSVPGSTSFAHPISLKSDELMFPFDIVDLSGDGKPDIFTEKGIYQSQISRPRISSFSPAFGRAGTNVVITGRKFENVPADNSVNLNGAPVSVLASTATLLTIEVPAGATSGKFAITAGNETDTSTESFLVTSIASFDPTSGTPGALVQINGYDFDPVPDNNAVAFGGVPAIVQSSTSTTITAIVPPGASTGFITITSGGITSQSPQRFVVLPPSITSFSPESGPVGTVVTIAGAYFDPNPDNNIVHFGGVKATVVSASASQLAVIAPAGATYEPITVSSNGLVACSAIPFVATVPVYATIDASLFSYKVNLPIPAGDLFLHDFDNDGKLDIVSGKTILKNNSTQGSTTMFSFGAPFDLQTNSISDTDVGDLDGDGRPEIIVASETGGFSIYKNNSSPGVLGTSSFTRVEFASGTPFTSLAIGDLDLDGKPDLALTSSTGVYIFQNEMIGTQITATSFGAPIALPIEDYGGEYFSYADNVSIVDLNQIDTNHKPEILFSCLGFDPWASIGVSVYENNTVPGDLRSDLFETRRFFSGGGIIGSHNLEVGDLNNDTRPDFAIRYISMRQAGRNYEYFDGLTILQGDDSYYSYDIGFSYCCSYVVSESANGADVKMSDLNGDGKVDLVFGGGIVMANASTGSTIKLDPAIHLQAAGINIAIGDIDGDGAPDIVTQGGAYRNQALNLGIANFTPSFGRAGTVVTITGRNFSTIPLENLVTLAGVPASVIASTSSSLTISIPSGASSGSLTITVNGQTATSQQDFTVNNIISFLPHSGIVGTPVTINGVDFDPNPSGNEVIFGDKPAIILASTDTTISATVPEHAYTGPLKVTSKGITSVSASSFTVLTEDGQVVTSVSNPFAAEIAVFPIPASKTLHVQGSWTQSTSYEVMSSVGNVLYPPVQHAQTESVIDIQDLPSGIYFLRVNTEAKVVVLKFAKE